ncbi:hypothetical protein VTG60DRAFT_1250 [Thermothelomyces hinnuleus]
MSAHDMDLLMDGATMNGGDGAVQQMQGIQGIQGIQGMEGLEGMEGMEGVEGMGGMNGMDGMDGMNGMDGMDGMGGAMALDEVDLFGDPVMDSALAGLPSRPLPSKALLQRLDEMRTRGCCQSIAWSRQGTIASISKDGMSIDLRFIRCNPDTTEWELSEPSSWSPPSPPASAPALAPAPNPPNPISSASASAPFVHLAWSPTMIPELAALDALGRLTLLTFSISSNQPYHSRRWEADVADDLHAVVGCYWLPPGMPQNKQASFTLSSLPGPCARSDFPSLSLSLSFCLYSSTSSMARPSKASPSTGMSIRSTRPRGPGTPTRPRAPSCV